MQPPTNKTEQSGTAIHFTLHTLNFQVTESNFSRNKKKPFYDYFLQNGRSFGTINRKITH